MLDHFCVFHGFCKSNHIHGSVGKAPLACHDLGTAPRFSHFLVHVTMWSQYHEHVGVPESSTWSVYTSLGARFVAISKNHSASEFTRVVTRDTTTVCERASHSQPEQEGTQNEPISTLDLLLKHWQVIRIRDSQSLNRRIAKRECAQPQ